jgi:hypothetical protein
VLTSGLVLLAPSASQTLFDVGGIKLVATCTAGGNAQISLNDDAVFLNWSSDSTTKGHLFGTVNNGSGVTILDQPSVGADRVSFDAFEASTGTVIEGTASGLNPGQCQFITSAIAANGAAPPAGQAPVRPATVAKFK